MFLSELHGKDLIKHVNEQFIRRISAKLVGLLRDYSVDFVANDIERDEVSTTRTS